ncbi:hypothetical protein LOZ80_31260 [Paenibacillus sp. HWE-109]|uniref:hypothetical protein n=1 Tax=Paenibacillus sp. HWE-109 TaxID=1306526 RepID=UPI001EDF8B32|nr:hypothetical protein [Paenibacillus sp. HWE-109]UKS25988.1 hypothetical protein LOZ80_31260 [Paenibacillus sp. HWE-109]
MEINLEATFSDRYHLEKTAEVLRSQGVLDIRFTTESDSQADSYLQSAELASAEPTYGLSVSVEKSRYRQAEDTILKYGGQLH